MAVPSMMVLAATGGGAAASGITDSFDRANSTTTLGNADTGQAWTANVGTWGISSNKAYCVATVASTAIATIDFGASADMTVQVAITLAGSAYAGVLGRCADANNFYLGQGQSGGVYTLFKRVAGTYTQIGTNGPATVSGDVMSLVISGTSVVLKVNGSTVCSATDSSLTTGTRAGLRYGGVAAALRWDNLSIT